MLKCELNAFFGLLLLFGVTKKSDIDIHEIWSSDSIHHVDYATAAMPRSRFVEIITNIVFDNTEMRPPLIRRRKFQLMEEIFDIFKINISGLLVPGAHICIDEQLYSFRGHCSFRQYMQSKPAKYGIKYWAIVDVVSSYILNTDVYLGKDPSNVRERTLSVGESVVLKLVQPYFYKEKRVLACENFFSSISLASSLYNKSIHFVGTLRKNKKEIPVEFQPNSKRAIESSLFGFSTNLSLVSYVPKKSKAVLVLSTHHHDVMVNASVANKPESILLYNSLKGGVDTADHLIENFSCRRKTKRWTFNVMQYLLDVAAHNAFCLYKTKNPIVFEKNKCKQRRLYLEKLALSLVIPLINERVELGSENNFRGISIPVQESMKRRCTIQFERQRERPASSKPQSPMRRRCAFCPSSIELKFTNSCLHCSLASCKKHGETITTTICKRCINLQ